MTEIKVHIPMPYPCCHHCKPPVCDGNASHRMRCDLCIHELFAIYGEGDLLALDAFLMLLP